MVKQSVALHQRGRGSPMTAVPHTGPIQASSCRRTQQPFRGYSAWTRLAVPPSAIAAKSKLEIWSSLEGWSETFAAGL